MKRNKTHLGSSVSRRTRVRSDRTRRTGIGFTTVAAILAIAIAACGQDEATDTVAETGTFVGEVADGETYVALVSNGEQIAGYLCDGEETSVWLAPTEIDDGRAELVSRSGESIGEVELDAEGGSGEVELDGTTTDFELTSATGDAGLYQAAAGTPGQPGAVEAGWIVLADGSVKGAKNSFSESGSDVVVRPAPAIGNGGAGGNGVVELGQRREAEVLQLGPGFIDSESNF